MKVAIVGAAGAIGTSTHAALMSSGQRVRVVGRDASKLRSFANADHLSADVSTAEGCARAVADMDAVVYTLGLPYTKADFARYPAMMTQCLDAARHAGVKRFVLVTNVYPYGIPRTPLVTEAHSRNTVSVKGEFRKQQEDLLLAAHDHRGLATLSLRLPNFYGPGALLSLADGIFRGAVQGKAADVLAPIDTQQEFVFTPDVGPVIAALLQKPEAFGGAYNFAGPSHTTTRAFADDVYRAAGLPKAKLRVAGRGLLTVGGLFSSLLRELKETLHLWEHPVLLDDTKLRRVLPDLKKTPYDEGIRQTLAAYRARYARGA